MSVSVVLRFRLPAMYSAEGSVLVARGRRVKKTRFGMTGGIAPFSRIHMKGERVTRSVVSTSSVAGLPAALLNGPLEPPQKCATGDERRMR